MNENVLKFKRPEKQPEPPAKKPRGPLPGWVPWVGLVALAVVLYGVQQAGWLGG